MKKYLALCLILLISGAYKIFGKEVSVEKARVLARNVYFERANLITKTSYEQISISEEFSIRKRSHALYYIFNINNDEGFVIIAADDIIYPVLAYSFSGKLDPSVHPPNVKYWLERYEDQIIYAKENNRS